MTSKNCQKSHFFSFNIQLISSWIPQTINKNHMHRISNELKIASAYDTTINMLNFVTLIQHEGVCGNVGHSCCTSGGFIFDANFPKSFYLTTTSLNMICYTDDDDNINKLFSRVSKIMRYMPQYVNNVKYKFLVWLITFVYVTGLKSITIFFRTFWISLVFFNSIHTNLFVDNYIMVIIR